MPGFNLRSKLLRSAGIYTVTNILNSAIPFLIMPVLTRYLTPSDYGTTATFQVLVGFVAPFTGLSINGAIARKFYDKDTVDLPRYVFNCFLILLTSSAIVGAVFWLGGAAIGRLAVFPPGWLWAVLAVSVGQFISLVALALWQVRGEALRYGAFQNIQTFINAGLSVLFVVGLGMNWQGRVWAQVLAAMLAGFLGIVILWRGRWITPKYDRGYVESALRFGVPLIPHAFGGWVIAATDRIMINNMIGVADTGVYTVGFQIASIIAMIEVSFNTAWVPWLYEKLGERNHETNLKIVKFSYGYIVSMLVLSLALAWLAPWFLGFFVGKDFRGASAFVFWLALAKGIDAIYFMTCNYIFYAMRTGYVALATFTAAGVHVVATYLLIRLNGTIGAAQATVVSSLVSAALVWFFAARLHRMPWFSGWSRSS